MAPHKSQYIFGFHDPGGENIMSELGKKGWVLFTHAVGHDPQQVAGYNYSPQASQGFGCMARLNHGYEPAGTIPNSAQYAAFAQSCAQWVRKSQGCNIWIIGNEMNFAVERPGVRYDRSRTPPALVETGEVISPQLYGRCYKLCRDAIRALPGHEQDEVLLGAVAPWNAQTTYDGNRSGDWIQYFRDILTLVGPQHCDGITIHTYTHGTDPGLIYATTRFQTPPFNKYFHDFLAYRDFMHAIPRSMRHLPVYITETDQDEEWRNENTGWVRAAYGEINWWNQQPGHQQILALLLYRWPQGHDRWGIEGKAGVIADFKAALTNNYVWRQSPVPVDYRVTWLQHQSPPSVETDSTMQVALRLRNDGNATWGRSGYREVRVHLGWYRDGTEVHWGEEQQIRAQLPQDVSPGSEVSLTVLVPVPAEAGEYALRLDLVEEDTLWFASKGNTPLSLAVTIEPPPPPDEEFFEPTQHWVKGEFLEFYHQYGLEITGYPIGEQYLDPSSGLWTQEFQRVVLEQTEDGIRLRLVGQYLQEAKALIALIRSQVEELRARLIASGILPPPLIEDVSETLPREAERYVIREASDVRFLVINHSSLSKDIELSRIATAHQRRGWPGIIYQYYIDRQGNILRTNPDEQVVTADADWALQGVNICFAGNFSQEVPSTLQIAAGAHLCAWLMQQYGLTSDAIVGISHFYTTESPGTNWTEGANWRSTLLAEVEQVWSRLGAPGENQAQLVASLRAQVKALQRQTDELQEHQAALELEIAQLLKRLAEREVLPPSVQDVTTSLPRDEGSFVQREREQIEHLVMHHSAVSPTVNVERIAETHRAHGWPGTMFHYFIDHRGNVQQTNPVTEIVSDGSEWLREGINVCIAGDFTQDIPTEAQLANAALLCAWLLHELSLPIESIAGAGEFYGTQSPGMQWLEGRRWKDALLQRTEAALYGEGSPSAEVEALRSQIVRLEESLAAAKQEITALGQERSRLQTTVQRQQVQLEELQRVAADLNTAQREIRRLGLQLQQAQDRVRQLEEDLAKSTAGRTAVIKPILNDVVNDLPKHESLTYETRPLDSITHVSVHHSAAAANVHPRAIAAYHIKEDTSRDKPAWPGIGYHYYLSPDGTIYQTNRHDTTSYHTGGNNEYTIGVCFAGNFTDVVPTPRQLQRGGHLVAWLLQELSIPIEHVWGHKEFPNNRTTSCPGAQWQEGGEWRQILMAEVRAALQGLPSPLSKPIRHYLLFWWRSPDHWARADWDNAQTYVSRFHPDCGFSETAASQSQYVLIVGGTAGVSWQVEEQLRKAGCNVERIAGVDEADTKRQLDELATSGSPFRNFEISDPWWHY